MHTITASKKLYSSMHKFEITSLSFFHHNISALLQVASMVSSHVLRIKSDSLESRSAHPFGIRKFLGNNILYILRKIIWNTFYLI